MTVAAFLESLERSPAPIDRATFERLRDEFYALPGNGAGGSLHVVLDDNNWERVHIEFCLKWARGRNDVAGERFALLLLTLTDEQLCEWLGDGYDDGPPAADGSAT